jgi:hypothetical protein
MFPVGWFAWLAGKTGPCVHSGQAGGRAHLQAWVLLQHVRHQRGVVRQRVGNARNGRRTRRAVALGPFVRLGTASVGRVCSARRHRTARARRAARRAGGGARGARVVAVRSAG